MGENALGSKIGKLEGECVSHTTIGTCRSCKEDRKQVLGVD